mgnify:CR=1 FL=1
MTSENKKDPLMAGLFHHSYSLLHIEGLQRREAVELDRTVRVRVRTRGHPVQTIARR